MLQSQQKNLVPPFFYSGCAGAYRVHLKTQVFGNEKNGVLGRGQSPHVPCSINLMIFFSEKIAIFVILREDYALSFLKQFERKYYTANVKLEKL